MRTLILHRSDLGIIRVCYHLGFVTWVTGVNRESSGAIVDTDYAWDGVCDICLYHESCGTINKVESVSHNRSGTCSVTH